MPQTRFKFYHLCSLVKLFIVFAIYLLSATNASATKVTASNIATIPVQEQKNLWHQAIASPLNNYHYYVAQSNGEIHLIDAKKSESFTILNVSSVSDKNSFIELTAFALHPGFLETKQAGFLTFYTAHTERYSKKLNKRRLPKKQDKSLTTDIVITEWQLSKGDYRNAKLSRELLRISSPAQKQKITTLAFNPYIKSWQDDFAFLYIAINNQLKNTQAIYSGSILRISTKKFGLRAYTTPKDNPFIDQKNIDNEIAAITASNVIDINWSKGEGNDFLLSTRDDQQQFIYSAKLGDDWRSDKPLPLKVIAKSKSAVSSMFYLGRNLNWLRQQYFSLVPHANGWQMSATSGLLNQTRAGINTNYWQIDDPQLNQEPELSLFPDRQGEPLAFSPVSGKLYRLFIVEEQLNKTDAADSSRIKTPSNYSVIIISVIFVGLLSMPMVFLVFRRINKRRRSIRYQFTRLEFSDDTEQIKIYRPTQSQPTIELAIADIVESSIYLNDTKLASVNHTQLFNDETQQLIENALAREYRHKMIDDKIRKIEVSVKTNRHKKHIICLYLRKGNTRITKKSYNNSKLLLLDWCWFISQRIDREKNN